MSDSNQAPTLSPTAAAKQADSEADTAEKSAAAAQDAADIAKANLELAKAQSKRDGDKAQALATHEKTMAAARKVAEDAAKAEKAASEKGAKEASEKAAKDLADKTDELTKAQGELDRAQKLLDKSKIDVKNAEKTKQDADKAVEAWPVAHPAATVIDTKAKSDLKIAEQSAAAQLAVENATAELEFAKAEANAKRAITAVRKRAADRDI